MGGGGELYPMPKTRRDFRRRSLDSNCLGRLILVGAGPGDPELLTVAAYKAIQDADVVIADRLVPQAILDLVDGELMISRKTPGNADEAQHQLNESGIIALKRGCLVVRLKGGDPFLFGRGAEEIKYFRKHGFEPQVIPGISSCLSAPLAANIPVTHRGISDQLLVTTGHGQGDTIPDLPQYSDTRTTVFLMAIGRLETLSKRLIEFGYPRDVPAAIVERATCIDERIIRGVLNDIAERASMAEVKAPATFIIGNVIDVLQ